MAKVWFRSRVVKTLAICMSASTLLTGIVSSHALADTKRHPGADTAAPFDNSSALDQQIALEDTAESDVQNQSEFVIAAVRTQLSDLDRFPLFLPSNRGTVAAASDQLSSRRLSRPSLFWIQDQVGARYGSDRLVERWQAYQVNDANGTSLSYVDAIVNERIWDLLTYFERYAFIEQFGTAAQDYGYHLRVFHTGDAANADEARATGNPELVTLRGAHVCSFDQTALSPNAVDSAALPCAVVFDSLSRRQRSTLSN